MLQVVLAWLFVCIWAAVDIVVWYVSEPIVYMLSNAGLNMARDMGHNTTGLEQGVQLLQTVNVTWITIVLIVLVIYAVMVSVRQEGIGYLQ